jgi:hypothetical protein
MKPYIGQKLENGAIVTSLHKQYPAVSCPSYLIEAYWEAKLGSPGGPYVVWDYCADTNSTDNGNYFKDSTLQKSTFIRRKMHTI